MDIRALIDSVNIADVLDDEDLNKIGDDVVHGYEIDLESRRAWDEQNVEWMKLALQVREERTFPWPKAANIKYPLLTTAALQFNARSYPNLVPSFDIVKAKPLGSAVQQAVAPQQPPTGPGPGMPPTGAMPPGMPQAPQGPGQQPQMPTQGQPAQPQGPDMQEVADKISTHMSYQVLYEMDDWEEEMDKLCLVLPIIGTAFKKTYYSAKRQKNCSELILPKDLIVNYWAKSLEKASRKTHRLWYTPNEIMEYQRMGLWREYDGITFGPGAQQPDDAQQRAEIHKQNVPSEDEYTPRQILEQHTFLDLDEDEYKEPYVVTVDYETKKVLRITARYGPEDVTFHARDPKKIACIYPREYFTKFSFIPNPDGSFYDLGFGLLLGSINQAANTLLNQLTDAGTLSNLQSGFLAKGLRLGKAGSYNFQPGEWKPVNNSFDDLKKGIYPLPVREPSNVLFQLLGMLVQSGKEMASIAEIFTGKMPGQNTPASTTMATIEQGLKVFTSIYKRMFRSLGKEFHKLFKLNQLYLPDGHDINYSYEKEGVTIDASINSDFYKKAAVKIIPAADPNMVTETQKLIQLQSMMELAQYQTINLQELTKRGLEIHGIPNIAALTQMPPPQPPLEVQLKQMELQDKDKDRQIEMMKLQSQTEVLHSQAILNLAKARQADNQESIMMLEAQLQQLEHQREMQSKAADLMFQKQKHEQEMQQNADKHNMDMKTSAIMNAQNLHHNELKNQKQLELIAQKAKMNGTGNNKGRVGSVEGKSSNP